ncbi:DUF7694 domain-containing protein [Enterococcus pallens]|uniref:DUF7694 domain-containing protein n=1 Tax=Enterococcus pallens ATCC BAA-351 TaxID=1158607 RepID=R2S1G8_9ENTE|nr:hypothetical protein [Enterococcus pallens]EOH86676.1 hypothetical protein UAU_05121 [Enterococcus pallens ATCC BAA-351]EOU18472.1 hypothetical protein I588_03466 [Enterococcus pallens ATCC BAA-351]
MKTIEEIKNSIRVYDVNEGIDGLTFRWVCGKWTYLVIATFGEEWDHVSISCKNKRVIPDWETMCRLKDLCFYENEVVMQLHPKKENYVNVRVNCLHLWAPQQTAIPTPPLLLV